MMNNKRYYWLKLKEDFFQQREIKKLRKIAGGDTYTIIYLKLQLLSLKNDCKLLFEGIEDTFSEEMALEIDEEVENVKMTLLFLQKHGLIEEVIKSEFILPKTLENIGTETQVAARVRKHREAKILLQCNLPVTSGNTEKELEKELELELDIKNGTSGDDAVNDGIAPAENIVTTGAQRDAGAPGNVGKGEECSLKVSAPAENVVTMGAQRDEGQLSSVGKGEEYSLDFLEFWKHYPRKKEKLKAWRSWKTRLREKCSPAYMIAAGKNYASECKGLDERYIKLGATFIGPDKPFEEYMGGGVYGENRQSTGETSPKDYTEGGRYTNFFK